MSTAPAVPAGRHPHSTSYSGSRVDRGWPMWARLAMYLGIPTVTLAVVWFTLVLPTGKWGRELIGTAVTQFLADQHTLMEKLGESATRNAISQETTAEALETISRNQAREARALEQIKTALQHLATSRSDEGAQAEPALRDQTGGPLE